jgi:hypothetical protein
VMMFGMYEGLDLWMLENFDAVHRRVVPHKPRVFQYACMS